MATTKARVAAKTATLPKKPRVAVVEKTVESPVPRPVDQVKREAEAEAQPKVKVNVPHQFNFIDDNYTTHTFYPGIQNMVEAYVDHWWVKQQGVVRV